jgi:hypothetical protein
MPGNKNTHTDTNTASTFFSSWVELKVCFADNKT